MVWVVLTRVGHGVIGRTTQGKRGVRDVGVPDTGVKGVSSGQTSGRGVIEIWDVIPLLRLNRGRKGSVANVRSSSVVTHRV